MGRLPVGNLQQSHTTQSGLVRADPNAEAQPFRDVQQIGGGLMGLGEQLNRIQDVWHKAKVTNQYTTARNNRKSELNDIMAKAKEEPDHNMAGFYHDEIERLRSQEVEIEDEDVKLRYNSDSDLEYDLAGTELDSVFRGKMISHQQGQILQDGIDSEDDYVNAATPEQRMKAKNDYLERLKASRDSGFMNNKVYIGEVEDTKNWEYKRALKAVDEDPEGALENLDQYKLEGKQKDSVIDMARTVMARNSKIRAIGQLKVHNANEMETTLFVLEDKETSPVEKLDMINDMEIRNEISKEYAVMARRTIKNKAEKEEETYNPTKARIIRMMYAMNSRYDSEGESKEYLKGVGNINRRIFGEKGLSKRDRISLQREFDNITKKKYAEATRDLAGEKADKDVEYRNLYPDADKFFTDSLPVELVDEAFVQFHKRVDGRNLDKKEAAKIATEISVTTRIDSSDKIKKAWSFAIENYGNEADMRMEKMKDGSYTIFLYKEGEKPRPIRDVK